jgi:diguanylate cyclase (GGDEF)-like protein
VLTLSVPYLLLPDALTVVVCLFLAINLLTCRRDVPGRVPFGVFLLAVAWWAFFDAWDLQSSSLNLKMVVTGLEYVGIVAIPVLIVRFVVYYTGVQQKWPRLWHVARWALWILPVVTLCFVVLDPWMGWVRKGFKVVELSPGIFTLEKSFGPWFYVHAVYSYAVLMLTALGWAWLHFRRVQRVVWNDLLVLLALLFPWLANVFYLFNGGLWRSFDPTTSAFTVTAILLFFNLLRFRFLDFLPVSRERLIENWGVPTLVFDQKGRLAFFNREAKLRWGLSGALIGLDRSEGIPKLSWLPTPPGGPETRSTDVIFTGDRRFEAWEAKEKLLYVKNRPTGTVLTMHDVTALRESQRALRLLNADLEVRVQDRTQDLQEANRRLSEELDQRRQAERLSFYYSLHDPLTGLGNRSYLLSRLGQVIERYRRMPQTQFGLIFINFNGFKRINESYGHQAGDEFLRLCSNRLKESLRTIDTAARYSGDQFVVILDGLAQAEELPAVASRLALDLERPLQILEFELVPSVRMGLALGNSSYTSAELLLADAEMACHQALVAGVERVFFHERLRDDVRGRWKLRDELGQAIVKGELVIHFQPIVRLTDRTTVGWEVLCRWNHPQQGLLCPNVFIPIAEESGIIHPLGLWVLREAAKTFRLILEEFPDSNQFFLAVNVSPIQLLQPDFPQILLGVWEREGLSPSLLSIEITEGALIENSETVIPALEGLRRAGVGIKLDDFGTGYSSLHYLHRLPIDTLKIDRSFVTDLVDDLHPQTVAVADSIVRSVLRLAEELNILVIAEGIETEKQLEILKRYGCPLGQGYIFSDGQPAEVLRRWIKKERDANLAREFP